MLTVGKHWARHAPPRGRPLAAADPPGAIRALALETFREKLYEVAINDEAQAVAAPAGDVESPPAADSPLQQGGTWLTQCCMLDAGGQFNLALSEIPGTCYMWGQYTTNKEAVRQNVEVLCAVTLKLALPAGHYRIVQRPRVPLR